MSGKKIASISFNVDTLEALDEFADSMGLSRSAAANLLISGCMGTGESAVSLIRQIVANGTGTKKKPRKSRTATRATA